MSTDDIGALGDTIFDIVFGFFNSMISILTGGAITDFLGGYSNLEDFWADIEAWLITEMIDGIQGVADFTQAAWVDNMNTSHAGLMEILDLSNYITSRYEDMLTEMEEQTETLIFDLDRAYLQEIETAEELVNFSVERLLQSHLTLETFSSTYYEDLLEAEEGAAARLSTLSEASIAFVQDYLAADRNIIQSLADAGSTEAAEAILAVAEEGARFVNEWFLETVVKPVSYAETMSWAITEANTVDIDTVLEEMAVLAEKWHKLQLSMIQDRTMYPGGDPISPEPGE